MAGYRHPTNGVKAPKETQSADANQEKSPTIFILSSSISALLRDGTLLSSTISQY